MKLIELEPTFLILLSEKMFKMTDNLAEADGVQFLCPKCFAASDKGRIGVHSVICWNPKVPQTVSPVPGRWELLGTGYNDLTLRAGSSSVLITSGCMAHFYINNGEIQMC